MCGITGILEGNKKNSAFVQKMAATITHRGPDDAGFFSDKDIALAIKRLKIIDLKTGKQPIFTADKNMVIVYNGEVYNYRELRALLKKKGHTFRTKSDTEVVLHIIQEYGVNGLKKLNGMFALAIWDRKKKQLLLARDRIGIKPLYYFYDGKRLIFASEIKAILQDKRIMRQLNPEALAEYITFQNILTEKTFFNSIKMLLPGNYLIATSEGVTVRPYWKPSYVKKKRSYTEIIATFRKTFNNAVKRHMISDVPLGSYLSGGFDSSSVATIAASLSKKRLSTFTGRFKEGGRYDESRCSRAVASQINARMHEITITPKDFLKTIDDIIYHLDEPKVALPAFSQYHVSKLVAQHVTVVLTGHGGDELFGGYPVYKATLFKHLLLRNPIAALRLAFGFKPSELPRILYFLFFPLFSPEVSSGLFIMFNKKERKKLFTPRFQESLRQFRPQSLVRKLVNNLSGPDRIQHLYLTTYLPSLLIVEDKMGMAHSIEARTPILDNEMVEFALSIPLKDKLHNNQLKAILKDGMHDTLPSVLHKQAKLGFPTPLSLWFRGELKDYIYSILLSERTARRGIFNITYVKRILDKHSASTTDTTFDLVSANKIWSLLSIELWFRKFID